MDLKVDVDKLAALAETARATAKSITSELDDLQRSSVTLTTNWQGDAQAAYRRSSSRADAQGRTRAGELHRAAERLARLADEYRKADEDGARAVLGL
ncbi:MAG: WXG100 family type VII secretion target [Microbacterium sp.]|uniref:WXG100 family type VII secretion target n=1 Tax=Microbacterium sp. TaxID=51671 RepID=UPI00281990C2|nr:WXG100 family type VII secretion target [Microbacterium sp.]MDR2320969.1 WXG100 family type VII secretion target [Microbacterium sp.]